MRNYYSLSLPRNSAPSPQETEICEIYLSHGGGCEDYCLVTPCDQVDLSQYFGVICCLQVQSRSTRLYGVRSQNAVIFMLTRARTWLLPVEHSSHPHTLFSKPIYINIIVPSATVSFSFLFRYSNSNTVFRYVHMCYMSN